MWRLRRLKKSVQTELYENTFDPHNPTFDEVWGSVMFIHYLRTEPETCFDKHAKKCLRRDKIKYLEEKFPPTDYESTAEWVNALIGEIMSASVRAYPEFDAPELGDLADRAREAAGQWKTECKVAGTVMHARELLEYEAKETERLNAMIMKQTRYCAELKAWEEAQEARGRA
jgi:hypothetical protein